MSAMGRKRNVRYGWKADIAMRDYLRKYNSMTKYLRFATEAAFWAALMIALNPLFEFLVAPPNEKAARWAVTVIALVVAAALRLYLHTSQTIK